MSESAENLDREGVAFVESRDTGRMLGLVSGFRPLSAISTAESEPELGLDTESHSKLVVTRSSMACVIARKLSMMRDVAIEVVERIILVNVFAIVEYQENQKGYNETHGQYMAGILI